MRYILFLTAFLFLFSPTTLTAQEATDPMVAENAVAKTAPAKAPATPKKILLEVQVFQIILSDEHRNGVDWEASISNYHGLSYYGQLDAQRQRRERRQLSFGNVNDEDFELLIEALDTVGIVNPLSNSQVETQPEGKAKIYVGLTEPYVITMTTNLPQDNYASDGSLYLSGRGVQFYFTPSIEFDGNIAVKIQPDQHFFPKASSNNELNVRAPDGETIVIGGLIKNEKIERLRKIPLLGDLPILGFAFRNPNQAVQAIEYVLFLTPRVIDND